MFNLKEFYDILCDYAPIELSKKQIEQGAYDNSGILIKQTDKVERVLFCLDLSISSVEFAKRNKCDTIITHHPAIYAPLKSVSVDNNKALLLAIKWGFNVISMHLNLDVAPLGIDAVLAKTLGAKDYKILRYIDSSHGYGREFSLPKTTFQKYVEFVKKALATKKVIAYGKKTDLIDKVASFCGAGGQEALDCVNKKATQSQVIVSSDMPHHIITALVESGLKVIIIPHYSAENIGMKEFYNQIKAKTQDKAQIFYFDDKRFS